jgi:hypothetical protein
MFFSWKGYVRKANKLRPALQGNFDLCIPRKGMRGLSPKFPHSCVFGNLYIHTIGPPIFLWQNRQTDLWEYINRSPKRKFRNWDCGCTILFLGIFVWKFRRDLHTVKYCRTAALGGPARNKDDGGVQ